MITEFSDYNVSSSDVVFVSNVDDLPSVFYFLGGYVKQLSDVNSEPFVNLYQPRDFTPTKSSLYLHILE